MWVTALPEGLRGDGGRQTFFCCCFVVVRDLMDQIETSWETDTWRDRSGGKKHTWFHELQRRAVVDPCSPGRTTQALRFNGVL